MYESKLKGTTGHNSWASGQKVKPNNIFEKGTLPTWLGTKNRNSRQRNFLIKTVVPKLIDDIDWFSNITEHFSFQEAFFSHSNT